MNVFKEKASVITSDDEPFDYENTSEQTDYMGLVNINNRTYGLSAQWRTIKGIKQKLLLEDRTLQVADDWESIPMDHCRACKQPVKKYEKDYFKNNLTCYVLFNYENGYCEECAKAQAAIQPPKVEGVEKKYIRESMYDVGGDAMTFKTDENGFVWYWKNSDIKAKVKAGSSD